MEKLLSDRLLKQLRVVRCLKRVLAIWDWWKVDPKEMAEEICQGTWCVR
ncbi:MAG: hypothetical protein KCHDKBKB_00278 [Elusimicrobia bacterium]|nr:hypothetical protein [Elusimicrobiota bacterium]